MDRVVLVDFRHLLLEVRHGEHLLGMPEEFSATADQVPGHPDVGLE